MTVTLSVAGLEVPDFALPATGGKEFRLSAQRGRACVIYFYPKDNTPGCTTEAGQFRDLHAEFLKQGCELFGVSRDSIRSHEGFKAKLGLPFDLLSDEDGEVCRLFGVIKTKKLYGREVQGIERSTFLIDAAGVVRREWRALKAEGHAAEVLKAAAEL
jgi:peroxiredoxin Q/BCP